MANPPKSSKLRPTIATVSVTPESGRVGGSFSASATVTGVPLPQVSFQWRLNGTNVPGATASTYVAQAAGSLTVLVTATNSRGSASQASAAVTVAAATPASVKINLLSDTFAGSSLDPAKWQAIGGTVVTVANSLASFTVTSTYADGFRSASSNWDLTGSQLVWAPSFANQRTSIEVLTVLYPAGEYAAKRLIFGPASGRLYAAIRNNASVNTVVRHDVGYLPSAHKHLRIREAAGIVHFETSPDRATWNSYATYPRANLAFPITACAANFVGGDFSGTPGTARIADVNSTASVIVQPPAPDATTGPVGFAGNWSMLFRDEFSGSSLDLTKWRPNWLGGSDTSNTPPVQAGTESAAYAPAQVTVSNGNCVLSAVASPINVAGRTYSHRSGMIQTNGKFNSAPLPGKPLVFEARLWLDVSSAGTIANWPAMWSNGQSWPTNGEIDVMEGLSGVARGHFHYPGGGPGTNAPSGTNTGWNVWSVRWHHGDRLEFAKNGVVYSTIAPRGTGYFTALSSPHYFILNLGVGGWGGPIKAPSEMRIDWVRIWRQA